MVWEETHLSYIPYLQKFLESSKHGGLDKLFICAFILLKRVPSGSSEWKDAQCQRTLNSCQLLVILTNAGSKCPCLNFFTLNVYV